MAMETANEMGWRECGNSIYHRFDLWRCRMAGLNSIIKFRDFYSGFMCTPAINFIYFKFVCLFGFFVFLIHTRARRVRNAALDEMQLVKSLLTQGIEFITDFYFGFYDEGRALSGKGMKGWN